MGRKGAFATYDAITLTDCLETNLEILRGRLHVPENMDVMLRIFRSGAFMSLLLAMDGMCDTKEIDEQILKPCMDLPGDAGATVAHQQRVAFLMENAVSVLPMKMKNNVDELIADALSGQSVLICEGCATACVMDTRGFEKRTIGKPEAERVVLGPHESFGESIRTNITLLRRIVQREDLITEFVSVGGKVKTRCALMYLRDVADEKMLSRIRKRLLHAQYDFAMTTGEVEQLIEDHPLSLIPQCVRTERPDRAASFLCEGQAVLLTDGSPAALGAPATIWHQLHTPDDTSMRWQYGTFLRIVRLLGILIHVLLPGVYLALLRFHPALFSPMLLTSVYETGSRVPVPVFLEALLMTLAFDLISEAGLRAPGTMGNALGIVSGLILGQSAVSADIVSPLLLIIVAASGLGGFCIPNYALSIGLKIVQLMVLCAGAYGGLYLILLVLLALSCALFSMQSVGSPLTAPVSPRRRGNPDILLRLPLRFQKAGAFFAKPQPGEARSRIRAAYSGRAWAAALAVGLSVYALGAGAAVPVCLNSAWLASLAVWPAAALGAAASGKLLKKETISRALCGAAAVLLAGVGAALLFALAQISREALLPLAHASFVVRVTAALAAVTLLVGGRGAMRLAYFLRWALAAGLFFLCLRILPAGSAAGLFPLLGAGEKEVVWSSLMLLPAALPALMIALPPQEMEDVPFDTRRDAVPSAGFFVRRVMFGALCGTLLLGALSLCGTYEGMASRRGWGERLLLPGAGAPGGGVARMLLVLLLAIGLFLCAVNLLLAAFHAAKRAMSTREKEKRT